ncbi:MAG TPA: hypothetical protein VGI64_09155 [Streptosporangiaceae bacterium]
MQRMKIRRPLQGAALLLAVTAVTGASLAGATGAAAAEHGHRSGQQLEPGNLLVSESVYNASASIITPGVTVLPPGCTSDCAVATDDGSYPQVFNNVLVDPSFGVSSPVFLDQLTPSGHLVSTLRVPDGSGPGRSGGDLVTSFSSKSEMALNQSTSGSQVTFMGYQARPAQIDVSNANTQAVIDPTNPVPGITQRVVGQLDQQGHFSFTQTNAYGGNNGRAAILSDSHGGSALFTAGNAGNGGNPQPDGVIEGAGLQFISPSHKPQQLQNPGDPTPLASFSIAQLGLPLDKVGKDTNFRGLTIFNNVVYTTKGSGSNGVNTVYFVDTTGKACPNGVGLPQPGAKLPTGPLNFDPSVLQSQGLEPNNMCILEGFPTALKSKTSFPFGVWFANSTTMYVADEGNGDATFSPATGTFSTAAAQTTAGLQKWVLAGGSWKLAYTLSSGLDLGAPYTVPGYPTGDNPATGLPWSPATDGLRNITGQVNRDGTVTIWGITSTVSGGGDQGADPNKLVAITDRLSATTPGTESFTTVRSAGFGQVLRGVSFTPGTGSGTNGD